MEPDRQDQRSNDRINDELTVRYNRDFEARWWWIEIGIWSFLLLVLLAGLLGLTGRGVLANQQISTQDNDLGVKHERIARYKTPSVMTVRLGPRLFQGNTAYLWVDRGTIEDLGLERIVPQPTRSMPGQNGVGYIFDVENPTEPLIVNFAMQPAHPGVVHEEIRANNRHSLFLQTLTLP